MNKITKFILKLMLKLLAVAAGFFVVTFVVYFFNLDMKFTSGVMEPVMNKFYDRVKRDTHL